MKLHELDVKQRIKRESWEVGYIQAEEDDFVDENEVTYELSAEEVCANDWVYVDNPHFETFANYQAEAELFYCKDSDPLTLPFGLLEEAGELAGKYKRLYRMDDTPDFVEDVKAELGDVLWYVSMLASHLGISLKDIAEANIKKIRARKANNTIKGKGDKR